MKGLTKRLTAAILLAAVCLTATVYSRTRPVELRLGFMAGSYWDAPNGNCYAVIDAAIERFEREHPNVHVTYTSGILKRVRHGFLSGGAAERRGEQRAVRAAV